MTDFIVDVFLEDHRLPAADSWAEAITANGFSLRLDREFDPRSFGGILMSADKGSGFGYYYGPATRHRLAPRISRVLGNRDRVLSLDARAENDFLAAVQAAATLARMSEGILLDEQDGKLVAAADAIKWARGEPLEAILII